MTPLMEMAASAWQWLSQEPISFLWVPSDAWMAVAWSSTNAMSTRREQHRVHKMEYGAPAKRILKSFHVSTWKDAQDKVSRKTKPTQAW